MPLPILPIALGLAQFVPKIVGWLGGEDAEEVAQGVVDAACKVTGSATGEEALAALHADAEMQAKFAASVMELIVRLEESDSSRIDSVNKTMRGESKSERWPQYSWRPFNGFLFGITMFGVYFVLPLAGKPIPQIDWTVWTGWAAVLGVTSWGRNGLKDKLASMLK